VKKLCAGAAASKLVTLMPLTVAPPVYSARIKNFPRVEMGASILCTNAVFIGAPGWQHKACSETMIFSQ